MVKNEQSNQGVQEARKTIFWPLIFFLEFLQINHGGEGALVIQNKYVLLCVNKTWFIYRATSIPR